MHLDIMGVIFGLLTAGALSATVFMTHSRDFKFSVEDLLLDPKTGRASLSKCGQLAALCVSTWGFVYLTLNGKLTEWFYSTYMLTWAGTHLATKWLDQQKREEPKP